MKNLHFIKSAVFVLILTSIAICASPVTKGKLKSKITMRSYVVTTDPTIIEPSMQCYTVDNYIAISYTNPANELLTFTITDISGVVLKVYTVADPSGVIMVLNDELLSLGGTGTYTIDMYKGDYKKKVESATVVILPD